MNKLKYLSAFINYLDNYESRLENIKIIIDNWCRQNKFVLDIEEDDDSINLQFTDTDYKSGSEWADQLEYLIKNLGLRINRYETKYDDGEDGDGNRIDYWVFKIIIWKCPFDEIEYTSDTVEETIDTLKEFYRFLDYQAGCNADAQKVRRYLDDVMKGE